MSSSNYLVVRHNDSVQRDQGTNSDGSTVDALENAELMDEDTANRTATDYGGCVLHEVRAFGLDHDDDIMDL